ncbi:hypothetical protein HMPREF0813_01127 [Streptococcus anginosus F0211]|uniref:Uncharacterized protein n=1 Tax=Streptococcus anginosus F0211 TaxID=706437 RepID=E6J1K2_STRAP|nr:hypothetical protein HMPREF0813_01127 [Streptococcus anginosus F0211]
MRKSRKAIFKRSCFFGNHIKEIRIFCSIIESRLSQRKDKNESFSF